LLKIISDFLNAHLVSISLSKRCISKVPVLHIFPKEFSRRNIGKNYLPKLPFTKFFVH